MEEMNQNPLDFRPNIALYIKNDRKTLFQDQT